MIKKDWRIRPAKLQDAAALAFVHVTVWRTAYAGIMPAEVLNDLRYEVRAEHWKRNLKDTRSGYWVAESGPELVGFVCGGPLRDYIPGYDCELYAIYILQAWQGQGIGKALVGILKNWLVLQNYHALAVWTLTANHSRKFYEALGAIDLKRTKPETFGEKDLTEMAYGWPKLRE